MPFSVRYGFSQLFAVPARKAYEWCTDYDPGDHVLMGEENAERQITRLTDSTVFLKDVFRTSRGRVEKQKLVQLYPDRLSWIATHLTGPNKYSQFLYDISAVSDSASRLTFTAIHLEYEKENLGKAEVKLLADRLCKDDSEGWRLLAKAMAKDLSKYWKE
jgi:hypothetical protein